MNWKRRLFFKCEDAAFVFINKTAKAGKNVYTAGQMITGLPFLGIVVLVAWVSTEMRGL